jgi:hypothetical protein
MKKLFICLILLNVTILSAQATIIPIGAGPIHKEPIPKKSDNKFPSVKGMNLEGYIKFLPRDFEAKKNIVIVAFKRKQQEDVDTWIKALDPVIEGNSEIALYELPVLEKFNFLNRLTINNGMRYGIPNKKARERTICLYLDKESFRNTLAIESEEQIVVFLLDNQGLIKSRFLGTANTTSVNRLKEFLK